LKLEKRNAGPKAWKRGKSFKGSGLPGRGKNT